MSSRRPLAADELLGTKPIPRHAPPLDDLKKKPAQPPREVKPHAGGPSDATLLELAAEGLENAEIAARLGRATNYIKHRMEKINSRLGARNRAHAVALYLRGAPRAHQEEPT